MLPYRPLESAQTARLAAFSLTMLAALTEFPKTSAAAVFGVDDRRTLSSAEAAIADKIGTLVSTETGAYCTAFCVAPDVIATASHCLFGTAVTSAPKLSGLVFRLASTPQSHAATPLATVGRALHSKPIQSGTTRLSVAPPIGAAQDWAVARLASPACKSGGLKLSTLPISQIRIAADKGNIYEIAVHADLPDTLLRYGGPCAIQISFPSADEDIIARDFAAPQSILFHTCDTGGGSSGSPLLIDTPTGPEVVGINVGTYVLSRAVTTSETSDAPAKSEPIANTAIWIAAIATAAQQLSEAPNPIYP